MIVIQPRDPPGAEPASFLGEFTIGRQAAPGAARPASYQLDDPVASVLAARVFPSAAGWAVTDLCARPAVRLNGRPLGPDRTALLRKGDVLLVGSTELIVVPDPP